MSTQPKCYYEFGPFRLDGAQRILLRNGVPVSLTQKALETLFVLVQNSGRVIEKDELLRSIWPDTFVEETTLAQNIFTLRKALGETPDKSRFIETVPCRGYRFVAHVTECARDDCRGTSGLEPAPALKSLAVLPFISLSPHEEDKYLGLGLADALITKLSNIKKVIVRPTSAVLKYQGADQAWVAVGTELNVDFVLEGKILKLGDRVRVTVQLISEDTRVSLWAHKFDESFTDIFTFQDRISERLVRELTTQLTWEGPNLPARNFAKYSEAHQYYLKGRYQWNRCTKEGFLKSVKCFRKAIAYDPNNAMAYAGLSDAYNALGYYDYIAPSRAITVCRAAAERAVQIDDTLAESHLSMAYIRFFHDSDWTAAEKEFNQAIELNSGYAIAYQGYGLFLTAMGRFDKAVMMMQRALELDPVSLLINASMAFVYYCAGQYDQALSQCQKALYINQEFGLTHLMTGHVYVQKKNYDGAVAEYQKAMELLQDSSDVLSSLGYAHAVSGNIDEAMRIISKLTERNQRYVSPVNIAIVYLGLGDKDRALEWLALGYEARCNKLVYLKVLPFFDPIRSDSRFTDMVNRMGL